MTSEKCSEYAREYRQLANMAPTVEAWAVYNQLADLWDKAAGEVTDDTPVPTKEEVSAQATG